MKRKILLLILLVLAFTVQSTFAQKEEANCGIYAWVTDKDPNGLNVRDKPDVSGKVIARLKHKSNEDDDIAMVYIVGYSNGWVKIGRAETVSGEKLFDDLGWISAKMVETGVKGNDGSYDKPAALYAEAKSSSKKIGTIPSEVNVKIVGYSCGFVKVSYKDKIGWLREGNICGNPVTTCS